MCNKHSEHFVVERQGMTSGEIAAIAESVPGGEFAEAMVRIATNDGLADAFLVHPVKDILASSCGPTSPESAKP